MNEENKNIEKEKSAEKGIRWALWLYGIMETLQKYIHCIETAISANIPKKEKLFCSNKFCREKLFIYNCEWKFITNSGLVLLSRNNLFRKLAEVRTNRSQFYWAGRKFGTVQVMPECNYNF